MLWYRELPNPDFQFCKTSGTPVIVPPFLRPVKPAVAGMLFGGIIVIIVAEEG